MNRSPRDPFVKEDEMSQGSDVNEVSEQRLEEIESLFVQTAHALESSDGSTITLRGVSPSTLYFADRPQREVGHMSNEHFVSVWDEGDNSFADDPPNAVLSFLDASGSFPEDTVVVLSEPQLADGDLSYSVQVLDGKLPDEAGPVALFIDPFGRPLSPVSAAGVNRRRRRRMR
jgi:hypothetical protein